MICYAIKNEEGKYLEIDDPFGDDFVKKINYATLFSDFEFAKTYCPRYGKVVKVEIREVERNEQM